MSIVDSVRRRLAERRTRALPAAFGWRWVFPAAMVAAALAIPFLGKVGADAVLRSNAGSSVERITDPAAPGYLAAVEQTPVGLVLSTDADDQLVGTTIVTAFADGGGYVIVVPLPLGVTEPSTTTLAAVYEAEGEAGVVLAMEAVIDVDIADVATFDDESWEFLIEAGVGELEVTLDVPAGTEFDAGPQTLGPEEVFEVYSFQSPDEDQRSSAVRQRNVWEAYLGAAASADDPAEVIGPLAGGIPEILRTLASGTIAFELMPTTFVAAIELHVVNDGQQVPDDDIHPLIALAVPFPRSPEPGGWPRLALLNGTGDLALNEAAISDLSGLGVQMNAVGNTRTFDVLTTTVVYSIADDVDVAEAVAASLGALGATYEPVDPDVPGISDLADIIVTLGADYRPTVG